MKEGSQVYTKQVARKWGELDSSEVADQQEQLRKFSPPEVEGIESFLEKFEEFLTKEVGDKWNYEWRSDGIFDKHNGLRFTTFTVWGEKFDN